MEAQMMEATETERQEALAERLKMIAEQMRQRMEEGEEGPKLANVANTCPTDPAELAMCDSCQ